MTKLDKLIKHFECFPGIGGRQARRFAFHILTLQQAEASELADLITNLRGEVVECIGCRRFFARNGSQSTQCRICDDFNRDQSKLLVVERDSDIDAIERGGSYDGLYFVLGGTLPLLNSKEQAKLRGNGLKRRVEEKMLSGLSEVILGFAVNPDGENTARYVETLLQDWPKKLTVTHLGRGLSTGSELEYADPDTIKNALENRS
ncbi:recombination protein RecR [bacterium]|nr:recombination protein RecR [bacterium]|tara:strand:+ start:276 stop:887 length:612 start_codon:yes stop_codon:yes gene_type:complete